MHLRKIPLGREEVLLDFIVHVLLLKLSLASMSIDVIKDLEMSTSGSSDSENEPPSPEYPGDNGDTPCTSGTHHRKQLFCSSAKRQHSGTDQDNHPQLLTILEEVIFVSPNFLVVWMPLRTES